MLGFPTGRERDLVEHGSGRDLSARSKMGRSGSTHRRTLENPSISMSDWISTCANETVPDPGALERNSVLLATEGGMLFQATD